jgi:two-component system invasion response regulator UvrY
MVRHGIRRLLDDHPRMSVIAEAETCERGVELARKHRPDVVLIDAGMSGMGGLEATRRIKSSLAFVGIVTLISQPDELIPTRMLDAGACGCLTKDCSIDEVIVAIESAIRRERYISADIARLIALSMVPGRRQSPFETLSQRELQVMMMVTEGQTVQAISSSLCLSPKTVSTYRYRLFDKLGVDNDVELTHLAIRHGIIEGPVTAR